MTKSSMNKELGQFGYQDIDIDKISVPYDGYFKLMKYKFRHRLFAGGWGEFIERELFERGHAVGVLLYDPEQDAVVLVEQVRVGAIAANCTPWQLEIVAGVIDSDDEAPDEVAYREAQEEAGVTVEKLLPMTRYLSSSGGSSESIFLYLGIADSKKAGGIHGLAEENEDILLHVMPFKLALEWVHSGKIENAATIIALQWLALNKGMWFDHVQADGK